MTFTPGRALPLDITQIAGSISAAASASHRPRGLRPNLVLLVAEDAVLFVGL